MAIKTKPLTKHELSTLKALAKRKGWDDVVRLIVEVRAARRKGFRA